MSDIDKYKYYEQDGITIYHGDCREILPHLPKVDLVLTDPPYGMNENNEKNLSRANKAAANDYGHFEWDKKPIEYTLLQDIISKGERAIVFGGNHYPLPECHGWLVWDKLNSGDFSDCELAWNNFKKATRIVRHLWNGMIRKGQELRYHPTQKPLEVMEWALLQADKAETILDPFMGSGTTLVAAKQLHRKAIGIEIEEKYCQIACKRLAQGVLPI